MKFREFDVTFPQFLNFLNKIEDYYDSKKCWIWKGSHKSNGYAECSIKHVNLSAHRVAYAALIGPIPKGMVLDHICRNRGCVNPWHLEPVTQQQNCRRGDTGLHHAVKTHCPYGHE